MPGHNIGDTISKAQSRLYHRHSLGALSAGIAGITGIAGIRLHLRSDIIVCTILYHHIIRKAMSQARFRCGPGRDCRDYRDCRDGRDEAVPVRQSR